MEMLIIKFSIDIQAILYSIKCLLDRLVPVFSYYYPGLSLKSTFGRIEENGKAKGFMCKVIELMDQDEILKFVYEQYCSWIKNIVKPRDLITHYNDLGLRYHYSMDYRLVPIHLETKVFRDNYTSESIDSFQDDLPDEFSYKDVAEKVSQTYSFVDKVFFDLLNKEMVLSKQHFRNKSMYEEYKILSP